MSIGNSWENSHGGSSYRLPGTRHLGWWAALAMLLSILLHVLVFFFLDRMKIAFHYEKAREIITQGVDLRQVVVIPPETPTAVPEDTIQPPKETAPLMEEVEILAALPKNMEIDMKPDTKEAEYALKMQAPAQAGEAAATAMDASSGMDIESNMPELGRQPNDYRPAEVGQITVDPGSVKGDDGDMSKYTEDIIKQGAGGKAEKGTLDGVISLDDMLSLPPNVLLGKKTMLPSDLLFEYNKSDLRESAKVGLMKLALLMDRNPELYCWIEGYTDLFGGDEFNIELSSHRAEAVKFYLVNSLRMDSSKIFTRGFGRNNPIIATGTPEEQSPNRRVEIRMRQTPPTGEPIKVTPKRQPTPPEQSSTPPTSSTATLPQEKPVLVKPKRALPVEEEPASEPAPTLQPAPAPSRAEPVEE